MTIREYIIKSIRENKDITIKYRKYNGEISTRRISNIEFSDEYGDAYIKAYCHLRGENRTFKISRIIEVDGISNSSNINTSKTYVPSSYSSSSYPSYSSSYSSSSNRSKSNEGCYIATMAYGDYDHPQVKILRNYRDQFLSKTLMGRSFIRFYYYISPKLVKHLQGHKTTNYYIRILLDKLIYYIKYRYYEKLHT